MKKLTAKIFFISLLVMYLEELTISYVEYCFDINELHSSIIADRSWKNMELYGIFKTEVLIPNSLENSFSSHFKVK